MEFVLYFTAHFITNIRTYVMKSVHLMVTYVRTLPSGLLAITFTSHKFLELFNYNKFQLPKIASGCPTYIL